MSLFSSRFLWSFVTDVSFARAIPAALFGAALLIGACAAPTAADFDEDEGDDEASTQSGLARSTGTWKPVSSPADGTYTGAGPWNGGRGCTGGMLVGTKAMKARVEKQFGVSVDGYACRQNTANTSQVSMHGTGRALDIFIKSSANGTEMANWLVTNHKSLGIQLVIYSHSKWNARLGAGAYGGPDPHTDHVHAELTAAAASSSSTGTATTTTTTPTGSDDDDAANDNTAPASSGKACAGSGACNPGNDGSGLMCSGGKCVEGCTSSIYCPGVTTCVSGHCR